MIITAGASPTVDLQIVDDSGLPVTGLVAATFPTLVGSVAGANADTAFPALSDLASLTAAYVSGGVKERGGGVYRVDCPTALSATAGTTSKVRGEATGKHVICEPISVQPDINVKTIGGQTASASGTVTFPAATLASTTNITAATGITVATNNDKTGYSLTVIPPTAAQVATAVWQDTTAGDFTVASSIGKSLYTSGNAPGAANGIALVGSNMGAVSSVTGSVGSVTGNVGGSVASVTGAVGSVTGNVGGNVVGSVGSVTAMVAANATQFYGVSTSGVLASAGVGSTAFLANAPSGGGGGSGSYTVTLTINDGTNPIQNATITLAINSSRYTATTNSNGLAILTPTEGSGTYTVSLTAIGYQFTPVNLTVSGNTSYTYSMTQISITPSTGSGVTMYGYTTDASGNNIEGSVTVQYQMQRVPSGDTGVIVDPTILTVTSNSSGLVQFVNSRVNATYRYRTSRNGNVSQWGTFVAVTGGGQIQSAIT